MYTLIATALALTGAAVAAPAVRSRDVTTDFGLHAFTADLALQDWAVVNAHVAAGTNAIQIQRPSVYQADPAYLNGTELLFGTAPRPPSASPSHPPHLFSFFS